MRAQAIFALAVTALLGSWFAIVSKLNPFRPPSRLKTWLSSRTSLSQYQTMSARNDRALADSEEELDIYEYVKRRAGHVHAKSTAEELLEQLRALDGQGSRAVTEAVDDVVRQRFKDVAFRRQLARSLKELETGRAQQEAHDDSAGDGVLLPETSTVECMGEIDGTELCIYTNLCVDIANSINNGLQPVYSLIAPPRVAQAAREMKRNHTVKSRVRHFSEGPLSERPLPPDSEAADPGNELLNRLQSVVLKADPVHMDLPWPHYFYQQRIMPLHSGCDVQVIEPREAVSMVHGGGWGEPGLYNGSVTWVDSYYSAMATLGMHLWGCSAGVMFPVLGAYWANVSRRLNLPPLDNLIITAHDGSSPWLEDHPTMWEMAVGAHGAAGTWCRGFLNHTLQWVRGGQRSFNGKEPLGLVDAEYAVMDALARALAPSQYTRDSDSNSNNNRASFESAPSEGAAPAARGLKGSGSSSEQCSSRLRLPYDATLMTSNGAAGGGTRVMWNMKDVPLPPLAMPRDCDGRTAVPAPSPPPGFEPRNRRVCARKAVVVGRKPLLLGGYADTGAFRVFAQSQLGLSPQHADLSSFYARPFKALVVDRGRGPGGKVKARGFANLDAMLAVLKKYDVPYDILDDEATVGMSVAQQAQVWSSHGLIITGHGAQEVNLVFAPHRAVLIEISPYGLWCTMYQKMATAMGMHVLPIYSRLRGEGLTYNYTTRAYDDAIVAERAASCDAMPLIEQQSQPACVVEYKVGAIMTPIAEFEHSVVHALEMMGKRTYPKSSPLDLIDGAPDGGPGPWKWRPGKYEEAVQQGYDRVCAMRPQR